ncbi:unnamed protein product [Urochloa decumbens]|uniref:Importin subunit alpha n=1 Tax=Urochloa decumbens TaxID=240449 RepID=A0ABC9AE21_9POAL
MSSWLRPSERAELRRSSFKASVYTDEGQRRRLSAMVDIRRSNRNRDLNERRRNAATLSHAQHRTTSLEKHLGILPQSVQKLYSDDIKVHLATIREFRSLFSMDLDSAIEDMIGSGEVAGFVQLLAREDCPELQFEAALVLNNILSETTENTKVVVDLGAIPMFLKLLRSTSADICEQAVLALGNVVCDIAIYRDFVLAHGAVFPLLQLINRNVELPLLRTITWTLSNFCHGRPQPNFEHVKPAIPAFARLIHSEDPEVLSNTCWSLAYLSDGRHCAIQAIIETGALTRLIMLLTHSSSGVRISALRVVCNIAAADNMWIQHIIDNQVLPRLLNLLTTDENKRIKKEACQIISIITGGTNEQIQAVINGNIIGHLVHLMQTADFETKKEAASAIYEATSGGTNDQIKYLVSQGCIRALCDLLTHVDSSTLMICLESLENILKAGEAEKHSGICDINLYAQMIDDVEGLDKIENIISHENNNLYKMAVHLYETYWLVEDNFEAMPLGGDAHHTTDYRNQQASVPPGHYDSG